MLLQLLACNGAPGSPSVGITPLEPTTNDDLEAVVQADGADPNGDSVTYTYAWFVDGAPRSDLTGTTVPASETTKGQSWKVVVTPSDGKLTGAAAEASVVIANSLPSAAVYIDPVSPTASDTVTATADTSDDDEDPVEVTWSWTRDGANAGLAGAELSAGTAARGEEWTVTATPDDGENAGEPVTVGFTIANSLPTLGGIELSPDVVTVNDTITASFSGADDLDGDAVTLTVTWWVDGAEVATEEVDAGDTSSLSGLFAKGQEVVVTAVPYDGYDEGAEVSSAALVVVDSAPAGTGARIDPDPVYVDSEVRCVGDGWSDADGDVEGWQVTWTVDGVEVSSADVLPAGTYARGSEIGCTLVPYDGETTGDPLVAPPVVVQNSAPACTSAEVTIGPDPISVSDTGTVTVDGFAGCADADGDAVAWSYAWSVNGAWVSSDTTLPVSTYAARGDSITLDLAPTDGVTSGTAATSNTLVVANAAPAVTSLSLSPATVYTDTTVSSVASAEDADGDAVTLAYAWTVDGISAGTSATLDGSAFARGQTVTLTVTPTDGTDTGAASSTSIVVSNTAPGAPTVRVTPSAPADSDALVCSVLTAASDADGDSLTYTFAWTVGGISYGSATTTTFPGDTIPASATAADQAWTCSVTASDGSALGIAGSATVTVGCDLDEDGYTDSACGGDDCDDGDDAVHPGAIEVCDAADVDEDCDGLSDDADDSLSATIYYPDLDGDTYGDSDAGVAACTRPSGYLTNGDDCDDTNRYVKPGGYEQCDTAGVDEDCDGLVNDADSSMSTPSAAYYDGDADGFYDQTTAVAVYTCTLPAGYYRSLDNDDCDDTDAAVNPDAEEVCSDGIDNNCDDASYPCGIEGDGSYQDYATRLYVSSYNSIFGVTDVNADGAADLVVSDNYDVFVKFGPLAVGTSYAETDLDLTISGSSASSQLYAVAMPGDVDGDGDDDLLLLDGYGTYDHWYLVDGSPTMADTTVGSAYFTESSSWDDGSAGAAGDLDDDGRADVYVANNETYSSSPADQLTVYMDDGTTSVTYTAGDYYTTFPEMYGGPTGDLDGDGIDDLTLLHGTDVMVINGSAAPVGRALNSTDVWFEITSGSALCALGDVTGDGYRDLGARTSTTFYLFDGPAGTGLTTADAYASGAGQEACTGGDTDGDGVNDLFLGQAAAYIYGPERMFKYPGPIAAGTLSGEEAVLTIDTYGGAHYEVADMTGDGYDDLVMPTYYYGFLVFGGGEP